MPAKCAVAALLVAFGGKSLQSAAANGDTRTISLHHVHTGEDITITYKRNGRYDPEALKQLNWFLRDWRRNEATRMDPELIDVVWEVSRRVGDGTPVSVIGGYRAPGTNAMLRQRSKSVARNSLHMAGHAMDLYIPGASLEDLRVLGLRLQRGGVGYYPTSGSPFVHLDTGSIRHWPRMTHEQLARVFPDGRTVHIPSDGQPLSGYALALADVEKHGGTPGRASMEAAQQAGLAIESKPKRNFLAALFGKDNNDEDEADPATTAAVASAKPAPRGATVVSTVFTRPDPNRPVPTPRSAPAVAEQQAPYRVAAVPIPPMRPSRRAPDPRVAASDLSGANAVIASRGIWDIGGLKQLSDGAALTLAAVELSSAARTRPERSGPALAYAVERDRNAGGGKTGTGSVAKSAPQRADASVPAVPAVTTAVSQNFDDVWMRAVVLAPDLHHFMSATLLGEPDYRDLRALMRKPSSALAMTFSNDPLAGMSAQQFSGEAIVFLDTISFVTRTAFLQQ